MRVVLFSALLVPVLLHAQPALVAEASVDQVSYAYGEPIVFRYTVRNVGTEATTIWGSSSCVLGFEIEGFDLERVCTLDENPHPLAPTQALTWEWTLDPADLGFPLADGTQTITGRTYGSCGPAWESSTACSDDLAVAVSLEAPRYLGGLASVGYTAPHADSVAALRQQFNGVVTDSFQYPDGNVAETWQISGVALDVAVTEIAASEGVRYAEAQRREPQPAQFVTSTLAPPSAALLTPLAPNPTTGTAALALRLGHTEMVTVDVVDLLGRRVALVHAGPLAAGVAHAFAVGDGLPAGAYVVRVVGETVRQSRRLVVAR